MNAVSRWFTGRGACGPCGRDPCPPGPGGLGTDGGGPAGMLASGGTAAWPAPLGERFAPVFSSLPTTAQINRSVEPCEQVRFPPVRGRGPPRTGEQRVVL